MECPICQKSYKNIATLRSHKSRDHPNHKEKKTTAEKRKRKTEKQRQRREEQKQSARRRDIYTIDDISEIGIFFSESKEMQLQSGSAIYLENQGAKTFGGYGVFASEKLYVGDVITKYEGTISDFDSIDDKNYAIQLGNTNQYLNGIKKPILGKGLGSFINKEVRKHVVEDEFEIWYWGENTRKNVEFIRYGKDVYVEVCRDVKPHSQLFGVYQKGYRCTIRR